MTVMYKFVLLASVALAVTAAPIRTPVRHSTAVDLNIANFAKASTFSSNPFITRADKDFDNSNEDDSSSGNDNSNDNNSSGDNSSEDNSDSSPPTPTKGSNDDHSSDAPTPSPTKGAKNGNNSNDDDSVDSSVSGDEFSGRATWFTDTTGSCDISFDTNDMIVAMNEAQMGGTSQCGKSVKISYGGKTATAKVVDTCPSRFCSSGSLDLSQAVFKKLASLDVGEINIKWEFA
ncbi:hypothetical protein BGZ47_001635 [Haplosporangium gracile]|nr:hypothetical protein BGZ47_001635 [Haplosporangium gracile]